MMETGNAHDGTGMSDRVKAIGQFELQLNGVLSAFDAYGLGVHIPEAKKAITGLALQLHERLSGKDTPIHRGKE